MKTKILVLGFLMIFLTSCFTYRYSPRFAPESTIQKVTNHRVAIATYYEMSEQEYSQRINKIKRIRNYQDMPIFIEQNRETQDITVAYLGANTTMDDNHLLVINPTYCKISKQEYLCKIDKIKQIKDY